MANAKKSTVVEEEVVNEVVEEVQEVVKPKKVNKPKHDPNELVPCRSVRFGELRLIGPKTHMPYSWLNEGDFRDVEYQDLVSWKALHSPYLFEIPIHYNTGTPLCQIKKFFKKDGYFSKLMLQ